MKRVSCHNTNVVMNHVDKKQYTVIRRKYNGRF